MLKVILNISLVVLQNLPDCRVQMLAALRYKLEVVNNLFLPRLRFSLQVLTAHSCSEDGLEDATTLLMQLSRGHAFTRQTVLALLLDGAKEIGLALCR